MKANPPPGMGSLWKLRKRGDALRRQRISKGVVRHRNCAQLRQVSARTSLDGRHRSYPGRILNRERLVDSRAAHIQCDDNYSVVVVSGDEDIRLWVVGGAATNL